MITLKFLNKFILQLFFIRLAKCVETPKSEPEIKCTIIPFYAIIGWIVPFTGWGNDFKYVGKRRLFVKLTSQKHIYGI